MREIVLDTETTGIDPDCGDRIVEIGCVELLNHVPTGNFYHTYINPEREMSEEATNISGITNEFLFDFPKFAIIADDFLEFIQDSPLVIHNAKFDIKFINSELNRLQLPNIALSRAIDTLIIAKNKFPGSPASLDFLCKRFSIETNERIKHGALIDAKLLSLVYLELLGGRQKSIFKPNKNKEQSVSYCSLDVYKNLPSKTNRIHNLTSEESIEHNKLLESIPNNFWIK